MENEDISSIRPPRMRRMGAPMALVTVLESVKSYKNLAGRYADECPAKNVQEESDLLASAQLRWRYERLEGVHNEATNWRISRGREGGADPQAMTNAERLTFNVIECSTDSGMQEVQKQYLASIKTMHALAGRVERRK